MCQTYFNWYRVIIREIMCRITQPKALVYSFFFSFIIDGTVLDNQTQLILSENSFHVKTSSCKVFFLDSFTRFFG